MKSKQNKEQANISRAKKPKKVDLFDDAELTTSPFHKMKTGSYLSKKGEWKSYAIFKEKTDDELFNKLSPKRTIENADKKGLKSIHLITESLAVKDVIFLVLDERYENPIRFNVKNYNGEDAYIKKLHDIAYVANAPNKRVDYNKGIADNINNGLFKKKQIKNYMKTNKLEKPTLVQKSEDGGILVLKNEIFVEDILIKNVPSQYQSLYRDKTN